MADRISRGAVNEVAGQRSQSWTQILRRNGLTRLNGLLVALGGATLATGSAPDATFLAIALVNTVAGAFEEARAKRQLDALAVMTSPRARVIRDGNVIDVPPEEVVIDDLLDLRPGDQLAVDAVTVADQAEIDESMATGESEPVTKTAGDMLTSGSWLVSGALRARVTAVGSDSYASRLADRARRFSLADSELMSGINRLLRWLSWTMVVIAPVLFVRELQSQPWRVAIRLAVAGLVGMIPEGLVLLTTLAFLAGVMRLARQRVLVQELPAVETLARVDSLCVDKTGTLTEGRVRLAQLIVAEGERAEVEAALAGLSESRTANATMAAIGEGLEARDARWVKEAEVAFSSARKWSAARFSGHGTWVVGAPDVIGADDPHGLRPTATSLTEAGSRVMVLARTGTPLHGELLPDGLSLAGIIELSERTRPAVAGTLSYFADQGVTVRVISGDSPITVRRVADKVGVPGAERAVDARSLPAPGGPEFIAAVEENRVFGRVTPEQKQEMVAALQARNHVVAMTGDGVNDVLALKDADLGVAMGSGSAITRGVAQVVLLDDDFDVLPSVVAEGRRVLANIELVAVLFLVKNVYSLIISVVISITGWPYPFLPRHLTLISAVGIGIPGFFLALGPNERRFLPGFLRRVVSWSVLAGSVTAIAVLITYASARGEGLSGDASRTAAIIVCVVVTLWVLWVTARPMTPLRALLVAAMAAIFTAVYMTPGVDAFFSLQHRPGADVTLEALVFGGTAALVIDLLSRLMPTRSRAGRTRAGR
ncbi:MAG: HAD-IC family P-type ATPase [Actinomycetota bacterium]|nr:HAD-IC family P-type ATPase [Actinomycetota bacterium]